LVKWEIFLNWNFKSYMIFYIFCIPYLFVGHFLTLACCFKKLLFMIKIHVFLVCGSYILV
jgi:hypothetical protein